MAESKQCGVCRLVKPEEKFYKRPDRKARSYRCNDCALEAARRNRFRQRYGLSPEGYKVLLDAQQGCCATCGGTNAGKQLDVDHDHVTGKVRGLLCRRCNLALGHAQDSPEVLRRLTEYLEQADG